MLYVQSFVCFNGLYSSNQEIVTDDTFVGIGNICFGIYLSII